MLHSVTDLVERVTQAVYDVSQLRESLQSQRQRLAEMKVYL
mgnify:CR=1 FL=1